MKVKWWIWYVLGKFLRNFSFIGLFSQSSYLPIGQNSQGVYLTILTDSASFPSLPPPKALSEPLDDFTLLCMSPITVLLKSLLPFLFPTRDFYFFSLIKAVKNKYIKIKTNPHLIYLDIGDMIVALNKYLLNVYLSTLYKIFV